VVYRLRDRRGLGLVVAVIAASTTAIAQNEILILGSVHLTSVSPRTLVSGPHAIGPFMVTGVEE